MRIQGNNNVLERSTFTTTTRPACSSPAAQQPGPELPTRTTTTTFSKAAAAATALAATRRAATTCSVAVAATTTATTASTSSTLLVPASSSTRTRSATASFPGPPSRQATELASKRVATARRRSCPRPAPRRTPFRTAWHRQPRRGLLRQPPPGPHQLLQQHRVQQSRQLQHARRRRLSVVPRHPQQHRDGYGLADLLIHGRH